MDDDEKVFTLMMDALDGEVAEAQLAELEAHLRARPELAAEWRMLRLVDDLLRQTPAAEPGPAFVERTMARLPAARSRARTLAFAYGVLLMAGVLPVVGIIWLSAGLAPTLTEPAVMRGLAQTATVIGATLLGLFEALSRILLAVGQQASQQPGVWGWLFVMIGLIVLWGGVVQVVAREPARGVARGADPTWTPNG